MHLLYIAADQCVAHLQMVVEEGERGTGGETVEPEANFGQFDGHGIEVHAVDAAF